MRTIPFLLLRSLLIFLFFAGAAQSALAHSGEPRLEISAESLNPGAALEVRGVDFEFEEQITLSLIGAQTELPLGGVTGDAEGVFVLTVSLPVDLAAGTYIVRATTDDHVVESPQINVWGGPQLPDEEAAPREEDDGLLAPMPTFAPGVSSTPLPQTTAFETPPSAANSNLLLYSAIAGIGIIALIGVSILRKR